MAAHAPAPPVNTLLADDDAALIEESQRVPEAFAELFDQCSRIANRLFKGLISELF